MLDKAPFQSFKTVKLKLISKIAIISICQLIGIIPSMFVQASNFDIAEINQGEVIAIARRYNKNKFDLVIIRQIPGQRKCWATSGSSPVTVDLLLLNFDFTGSCQRATDSNSYSIRIGEDDLGLDYSLRIVEYKGELILKGHSHLGKSKELIIGRSNGVKPGHLKINLEPGWRFAKRVFNGKTLGHFYIIKNR